MATFRDIILFIFVSVLLSFPVRVYLYSRTNHACEAPEERNHYCEVEDTISYTIQNYFTEPGEIFISFIGSTLLAVVFLYGSGLLKYRG